ncbi:MAG: hypothetical protein J6Q14_08465 [Oscillospiraceae bacterium]|nr:hypothetical protein [Oscillospiraceae bacterium]
MLRHPQLNEAELREASRSLDYTNYTYRHMRRTYSSLLTYHNYVAPSLTEAGEMGDSFWREYRLAEKLRKAMKPAELAREAGSKSMLEGKTFWTYRVSSDKSRNRINHAFYQQLPSEWIKIVGRNNISKYTLAFDMMYFCQPGTDVRQFPEGLFDNYWNDFNSLVTPAPRREGSKVVYAARTGIDMSRVRAIDPDAEVIRENGRWYYWVTLPVDKAVTIEVDEALPEVTPPMAGLFIGLLQFADLTQLQLQLYQNPLVGFVHGEIPYFESKDTNTADQYKLSHAGLMLFTELWNQLMAAYNTGGVPIYFAPAENMKLETFNEVSSTSEIVSQGNSDIITQAGLSGLIPASDEARAGAAQISFQIEGKYLAPIYAGVERLMACAIADLRLKHEFEFHMFGDLYMDNQLEKQLRNDMTLGILPAAIQYNALHDRSLLDDICWSDMVAKSGVLDKRIPLVSSYSAKQSESQLPPQAAHDMNPGGRPEAEGVTSDGQENDVDSIG